MDHDCLHEKDFEKLRDIDSKLLTVITNLAANTAVIANLVAAQSADIILKEYKKEQFELARQHNEMSWKKVAILSTIILSIAGIAITLILKFAE